MKIIELNFEEQEHLLNDIRIATANLRRFRIAIDDDQLKWKVGEGIWTIGRGRLWPRLQSSQANK
jgi:hypothetical protein